MILTKLEKSIEDSSLYKLDEFFFGFDIPNGKIGNDARIRIGMSSGTVHCRIVGDAHFTDSAGNANLGKEISINEISNLYISSGKGTVYFDNKSKINFLNLFDPTNGKSCFSIEKQDLMKYLGCYDFRIPKIRSNDGELNLSNFVNDSIVSFVMSEISGETKIVGDVSCIPTTATYVSVYSTSVSGSIEHFADSVNMTNLSLSGSLVSGNISSLQNLKKMTSLNLVDCKNVSGTVESLLDGLFSKGKTSGSLLLNLTRTNITYNGVAGVYKTATFSSSGWTVN